MGKQITIEQLIEKHIIMKTFKAMIMNIDGVNEQLWEQGRSILCSAGGGAARRVGLATNTRGFLPRFGPHWCVKP